MHKIAKPQQSETLEECDTYRSNKNSVTIKCSVNLDNLVGNFQFSECIPLRIVRYNDKVDEREEQTEWYEPVAYCKPKATF